MSLAPSFLHLYVDKDRFSQIKQGKKSISLHDRASSNNLLSHNLSVMQSKFWPDKKVSCYQHSLKIKKNLGQKFASNKGLLFAISI